MRTVEKVDLIFSLFIGATIILAVVGLPSNVYNHSKMSTYFGISIMCIVISLVFLLTIWQKRILFRWIDVLLFCFLVYYLVDFEFSRSLYNIGYLCLLLVSIIIYCRKLLNYSVLYWSCLLSAFILIIWGYLQYFEILPSNNPYFLITGSYHNPAIFAIMLAIFLSLFINALIIYRSNLGKSHITIITTLILLFTGFPILILTYARAAYLGLIVSVLYTLYFYFLHRNKGLKRLWGKLGLILFIFSLIGVLYMIKPKSADGRLLIWRISWDMIKDKPITGFGTGGFAANYMYYQANYMRSDASNDEKKLAGNTHLAFNEPLRMMVEHGVIGLLIYLAFIAWVFLSAPLNNVSIIAKSIIANISTWSMFAYPDQVFPITTILVLAITCCLNKSRKEKKEIILKRGGQRIIIIFCTVLVVILGENLCIKFNAYRELHNLFRSYNMKELCTKFDTLSSINSVVDRDPSFLYFYCHILKTTQKEDDLLNTIKILENTLPTAELLILKGECLQEMGRYDEAEVSYRLAADMLPSRQTARGKLAILLKSINRKEEAVILAREILTEEVKVYGFNTFELHRTLKGIFEDELK